MTTPAKEDCAGCGGNCVGKTPGECRGPKPVPWLPFDRCMFFYEARSFDTGIVQDRRIQIRVTYQHCLKLLGRQQGPLLFTTSILPGEQVKIYEFDRLRRVRSETQRVSVHTSFRQTVSALSQSRRSTSTSTYADTLAEFRTHADSSVSAGGGLAGFLGAPQVKTDFGVAAETTVASGASAQTASEQFSQLAVTASQAIEAERSLVISRFEEAEHQNTTVRTLMNANHCYAVTYFVRRVNEVYEISTNIVSIEWRVGDGQWRSLEDLEGAPDDVKKALGAAVKHLPKVGESVRAARELTLPTDGTVYEAELAHCSSCEPVREAEELVKLEQLRLEARRACLEAELLSLELERRRGLMGSPDAAVLELRPWPFENAGAAEAAASVT